MTDQPQRPLLVLALIWPGQEQQQIAVPLDIPNWQAAVDTAVDKAKIAALTFQIQAMTQQ